MSRAKLYRVSDGEEDGAILIELGMRDDNLYLNFSISPAPSDDAPSIAFCMDEIRRYCFEELEGRLAGQGIEDGFSWQQFELEHDPEQIRAIEHFIIGHIKPMLLIKGMTRVPSLHPLQPVQQRPIPHSVICWEIASVLKSKLPNLGDEEDYLQAASHMSAHMTVMESLGKYNTRALATTLKELLPSDYSDFQYQQAATDSLRTLNKPTEEISKRYLIGR